MTQYLDYTGLQQYTNIVKQKLGELSGRGRYLSNWNCTTGLPATNPETLPYLYKSGDYFIVGNAYANPAPEHIEIGQLYGDSLSEISVDLSTWKSIVQPTTDVTQNFTYTNIEIEKTQTPQGDTSVLYILDQSKLDAKLALIEPIAEQDCISTGRTFISFAGIKITYYVENNIDKLFIYGLYNCTSLDEPQQTNAPYESYTIASSEEGAIEYIKSSLLENYGIAIEGNMVFKAPWLSPTYILALYSEVTEGQWTYLGQPVTNNDLETAYGITYTGTPVIGDIIEVNYKYGKINYRPSGTSYTGQPSEVVEEDVVKVNDTYLFDGTNWILLNNTSREITIDDELSLTSTNPVQNKVITAELNKKSGVIFRTFESEDEEESE